LVNPQMSLSRQAVALLPTTKSRLPGENTHKNPSPDLNLQQRFQHN